MNGAHSSNGSSAHICSITRSVPSAIASCPLTATRQHNCDSSPLQPTRPNSCNVVARVAAISASGAATPSCSAAPQRLQQPEGKQPISVQFPIPWTNGPRTTTDWPINVRSPMSAASGLTSSPAGHGGSGVGGGQPRSRIHDVEADLRGESGAEQPTIAMIHVPTRYRGRRARFPQRPITMGQSLSGMNCAHGPPRQRRR